MSVDLRCPKCGGNKIDEVIEVPHLSRVKKVVKSADGSWVSDTPIDISAEAAEWGLASVKGFVCAEDCNWGSPQPIDYFIAQGAVQ